MKAVNIAWDTDGNPEPLESLPNEIEIPKEVADEGEDAISDYLSDTTGFCHFGYDLQE